MTGRLCPCSVGYNLTQAQAHGVAQRDSRSHKLNVWLRAHWGCHDLTTLNSPEVLLQPMTAADDPAIEPKRNYPPNKFKTLIIKGHGPRRRGRRRGVPLAPSAAGPQPIGAVTPRNDRSRRRLISQRRDLLLIVYIGNPAFEGLNGYLDGELTA